MNSVEQTTSTIAMEEHGLKKHDMKVSTVVFMIFCLVAAGAYGIEEMVPAVGPGLTVVMLIVLPFVWGLPFGLVASELGSVRPQEGGYYKWVQEALGEFWGFQAGWWRTISIYIDNTLYVILAGGYAATQWNLSKPEEFFVKFIMIMVFTYINIRGVKDVGIVSTVLSILVIAAFTMVAVCGFTHWTGSIGPFTAAPVTVWTDWIFYIGAGISIGMWMYSGYESMSTIAGEITNPQVIPKGTLITVPLIMAVYILPTIAGLGSMGRWEEWAPDGGVGYATVVTTYWGPAFGIVFVVVAILAQCSIYNTYIASGSRGFFALADDYLAPPLLVKCDKKHGVPYVAVLSVALANLILCMIPFGVIIVLDVFLLASSYVMVYLSAMILRKRIPASEYQFRIPGGYGFLCFLCIMPMTVAFISFMINGSDYFLGGMAGLTSGPILYVLWKRRYGGLAKKDPVGFPVNPKTGLATGDLKRMSFLFLMLAAVGLIGVFFLPWYEASWGSADYFEGLFESAGSAVFATVLTCIKIGSALFAVTGIVLAIVSAKVERREIVTL
jgi:amino acid transporter